MKEKNSNKKNTKKAKIIENVRDIINTGHTGKSENTWNTEIISGIHSVREALRAGKRTIYRIFISDSWTGMRIKKIINSANNAGILVESTDTKSLDSMTKDSNHQGIVAKVSLFPIKQVKHILKQIEKNPKYSFILILDNLEDPHNFGALIRTALCAGVDCIFIPKDRSVSPLPSVSRASAGAMEHASIALVTNTVSLIRTLKNYGFWVAGLDANGSTSIFKADLTGNIALIVGGEHKGIRPLVKKECDFILSLPMEGNISSLNASVAGGIAIYEVIRQRKLQT